MLTWNEFLIVTLKELTYFENFLFKNVLIEIKCQ